MSSPQPIYRNVAFGRAAQLVQTNADGVTLIKSADALEAHPERLLERLVHWANLRPEHIFLARRSLVNGAATGPWEKLSYQLVLEQTKRIGSALVARALSQDAPIAILSENDLDHARLALAALYVGIPYAPVSVPYSLQSQDHSKLKHIVRLLTPGMLFVSDGARYCNAVVAALQELQVSKPGAGCEVVVARNAAALRDAGISCTEFSELLGHAALSSADQAFTRTNSHTIAKFLFTSGSTKLPKAVINTQGMMSANQQMISQCLPFLQAKPPVLLDWLPWNHTFGGNHNVGIALYHGGSLYIDDGKPMPGAFEISLQNLREVSPTIYFNVPRGFDMLSQALKADDGLRQNFFKNLDVMFYAGASLPPAVWQSMYDEAERTLDGLRVPMITSLGMTESAPAFFIINRNEVRPGEIGVVMPGVELRLVPVGDKLEGHYRGKSISPGYWKSPDETAAAIDHDGWFNSGDAFKLVDPANPDLGLRFDGRTAEDFKLDSGTWVSASTLRARLAQLAAPYVSDSVITGADRSNVAALLVANPDLLRALAPHLAPDLPAAQVLRDPMVKAWFADLLKRVNEGVTGSAERILAFGILEGALSLDKGEVTDKGSLNQRAIIKERGALVEAVYNAATGAPESAYLTIH
jgi:feruloyl-CoA synthase